MTQQQAQQHQSFEIEVEGLAEAEEWGGERRNFAPEIPPGEYLFSVLAVTQDTSKRGNPMVVVEFEVADGEYAGKTVKNYYALTEKALGRMQKLKKAVGATMDNKVRSDELVGAQLYATIAHEESAPQKNADGTVKLDPNTGEPYPPFINARLLNERQVEAAAEQQQAKTTTKAAPAAPPVTRNNKAPAATQTRRA